MQLELISFPLCPYVQRSVITLRHKRVDFRLTHIDLSDPPPWFEDVSPLGRVPVLRVDGTTSLFESAVINEFLDEVTEPHLLPEAPVARALERGWIAHASTLLGNLFDLMMAKDATSYDAALEELGEGLEPMERFLEPKPLFRGASFSLADAAFAPMFMRLELCQGLRSVPAWDKLPKLRAWSQALAALPEVRESVPPTFADDLTGWLRESGSYLARSG